MNCSTSTRSGVSRRAALAQTAAGFGALVSGLCVNRTSAGEPLLETRHHAPRAQRVIQLFMNGGVSQVDTFDPKPLLDRHHGERFDPGTGERVESVTNSPGFKVLRSPFEFRRYGQSGRWVSSVFPRLAERVDEIGLIRSMHSKTNVHGLGSYLQTTGFVQPGFPCAGAWISYALGRLNENLPDFVVLPDARGLPYNNLGNFTSGFLPVRHRGTVLDLSRREPLPYLRPPAHATEITAASEREGQELIAALYRSHLETRPGDSRLEARLASYEMAARLQLSVPELFDTDGETTAMRRLYGLERKESSEFGRRCLLARRMIERGVRFVQVWSGAGGPTKNWDNHANIRTELPHMARQVDQPIAGLLQDLKERGLLEDTLVIWTTEFGRMPFSQGQEGRDHNGGTFVTWLAGAGIRGGAAVGESDDWGWKAREPFLCHDLHATMLHLLGIDHTRLTVRHNGIDRRLTDVHGHLIEGLLA